MRRSVDADRRPGRVLLTGSAVSTGVPIHSGAGRIFTLRMRPPSLAARLLGADAAAWIGPRAELLGPPFESLVTLSVRVCAQPAEARVLHLRTRNGDREGDLIVVRADGRVLLTEVKLSPVVRDDDVRHLRWLRERRGDARLDAVVVTTGREADRRPDGIAVVPAALLGP